MNKCKFREKSKSIYYLCWICKNISGFWYNSWITDRICENCPDFIKENKDKGN